jgi:hypothetical protein
MKTRVLLLTGLVAVAATACVSPPKPIAQPNIAPAQVETRGCYYAGELFSVGAVKPSMAAVPSGDGGTKLIDDPTTAVPLKCVMQFDGTRTTFAWVVAAGTV